MLLVLLAVIWPLMIGLADDGVSGPLLIRAGIAAVSLASIWVGRHLLDAQDSRESSARKGVDVGCPRVAQRPICGPGATRPMIEAATGPRPPPRGVRSVRAGWAVQAPGAPRGWVPAESEAAVGRGVPVGAGTGL